MSDKSQQVVAPAAQPATPPPPAAPVQPVITLETLAGALREVLQGIKPNEAVLASAMTDAINATKPKAKVTVANRTRYNPNNPTNEKRHLPWKFYQNYSEVELDELRPEEYAILASGRVKPGQFLPDARLGFLLEIVHVKRGSQIGLHLRHDSSKLDRRMNLQSKVPTMAAMLEYCAREHEARVAERKRKRELGIEDDDE